MQNEVLTIFDLKWLSFNHCQECICEHVFSTKDMKPHIFPKRASSNIEAFQF